MNVKVGSRELDRFRTATTKHDNDLHDRLTDSLVNYEDPAALSLCP